MARIRRRSSDSSSHRGTDLLRTPGPLEPNPRPVMTSTQRRPASWEAAIKAASARCASACVIECRSRVASILCRPRLSLSALARSIPAKRSSGSGTRDGLAWGFSVRAVLGSNAGTIFGAIGSPRARNGFTSRTACCHTARSPRGRPVLLAVIISRRLITFDQHNMETPGPVRTELDVLLDICRARRTGDEIDRPRQSFRHTAGA
jgi:hypothetical protein